MTKNNNTFEEVAELSISGTTKLTISRVKNDEGQLLGTTLGKKIATKTGEVHVSGCPLIPPGKEAEVAKFITKSLKA